METTVDCKYGIITGMDVYLANKKENLLVLQHLERQETEIQCKIFHLILATIPVLFILDWKYWVLQNIFLLFSFPTLWKSTAFTICPKKMRFVVQRVRNLFTNGWTVAKQSENICDVIRYKATLADIVNKTSLISSKQAFSAEFLKVVAILLSIESTNVEHECIGSDAYWYMLRLRKIWADGSFSCAQTIASLF